MTRRTLLVVQRFRARRRRRRQVPIQRYLTWELEDRGWTPEDLAECTGIELDFLVGVIEGRPGRYHFGPGRIRALKLGLYPEAPDTFNRMYGEHSRR